ncbi:MAG: type II toxin-antitoxin system HicA family toxin [Cyanobacteria bacterium J06631_9]
MGKVWAVNPNVRFSEVSALIIALGGELKSDGGSHYRAKLNGKRTVIAKPHGGSKTPDAGAIKGIKKFLQLAGINIDDY